MVSDTTTTPASAVRSAGVKPRPLTTSMPSTSKYSDDTASWYDRQSSSAPLPERAPTGLITPRVAGDDAAIGLHQRIGPQRLEQRGAP